MSRLIVYNISRIYGTCDSGKKRGAELNSIEYIDNGYIVCEGDKILEVGSGEGYKNYLDEASKLEDSKLLNAENKVVLPGFIDGHTHLIHGGSREDEFIDKISGVPYLEILKNGGGILSTVTKTRNSSFEELYNKGYMDLNEMLLNGVTTVEAKSGYGLNLETEIKQLEVSKKLNDDHSVDIKSTFLAPHAVPPEYSGNEDEYIDKCIEWLNVVKDRNLAEFCDVFCEEGVFTLKNSKRFLQAAGEMGFKLKVHADEIYDIGASKLAAELSMESADHLLATNDDSMKMLSEKNIICNLLPFTSFSLGKSYARARKMIEYNLPIEISSDYNPGSGPNNNFQFVMQLGCIGLRLTPIEVLNAVTINAAYSLCENENIGTIEANKKADFVILNCDNLNYMFYRMGKNHINTVVKNGNVLVSDGKLL